MVTKIGVVQMKCTFDKLLNYQQALKFINQAKSVGAKVVFLPEACDFIGRSVKETISFSETISGDLVSKYRHLAKSQSLWLSLGVHIKDEIDNKIENVHILINSDGDIVAKYAKVHLFDADIQPSEIIGNGLFLNESEIIQRGKIVPTVVKNTPIGNLGLAICYDMRFPELASNLRYAQSAQVLTYPSAFTDVAGEAGHWHVLLRARAIENQCYVIAAAQAKGNKLGKKSGDFVNLYEMWRRYMDSVCHSRNVLFFLRLLRLSSNLNQSFSIPYRYTNKEEGAHNEKRTSYGHSMVIDPWGRILGEQLQPGPGLLVCDIGPQTQIDNIRQYMPLEHHRRFDLFPMSDSGLVRSIGTNDYQFGPNIIKVTCVFYRSPLSFAFVNISPLVPGHILVCPVKCVSRFDELNSAEVADLYMMVKQIASRLADHHAATGLTISIQDGPDAGQSVPHVHVHVLPRKPNDFSHNDDIYEALQNHDKEKNRTYRSVEDMADEATVLRRIFYPNL